LQPSTTSSSNSSILSTSLSCCLFRSKSAKVACHGALTAHNVRRHPQPPPVPPRWIRVRWYRWWCVQSEDDFYSLSHSRKSRKRNVCVCVYMCGYVRFHECLFLDANLWAPRNVWMRRKMSLCMCVCACVCCVWVCWERERKCVSQL
jgi:hypothetical protein